MAAKYTHKSIEQKWAARWSRDKTDEVDIRHAQRPYYNLMMFPYPSAEGLHVGNVFAFVGSDIHGRFMRAQGYDVFEPMGFDAFGMHSENYALKVGEHPCRLVPACIERFREHQLKRVGAMFDWSHQVSTTAPAYYRWTQWIFVQLYRAGLAYRRDAPVNWCPSCQTVLADEQAAHGVCERCESTVLQRDMEQWFLRITAYAQRLLENLDELDWSASTKAMQRQWIGRSDGVEITFGVRGSDDRLTVFTTRPETLWGATFIAVAPEHPLAARIASPAQRHAVAQYVESARNTPMSDRERGDRAKTGVFSGRFAVHPGTGNDVPIWVSDYVMTTYGTGAVMGVPAHDVRDFEFAATFGLPAVAVINPDDASTGSGESAYEGHGCLTNSGPFTGLQTHEGAARITEWLAANGSGRRKVAYRLRDWCISRQRYWGAPIPIIHCEHCGGVPVPEAELPVLLPQIEDFAPDGSGRSPLARDATFVRTDCPTCGAAARRETDVCDNFLDSAWYFLRYPSAGRADVAFDPDLTRLWLPVDTYIGGNEHAVLHLLYTRFVCMALHDLGWLPFEEPFRRFRAHGLIIKDGAKMSKSKGNVINPDHYIERYGADTFRTYLMFLGPYQKGGDFRDSDSVGVRRFLDRVWHYVQDTDFEMTEPLPDRSLARFVHERIKKVTEDITGLRYNTAIAALMELLNRLRAGDRHFRFCARTLLQLLCPFAPFITHELWEKLGEEGAPSDAPWPKFDPQVIGSGRVEIAVLVNGKVQHRLAVRPDACEQEATRAAFAAAAVRLALGDDEIVRTVYAPGRLLAFVTKPKTGGGGTEGSSDSLARAT